MRPEALTNQGKIIFPSLSQFADFYLAGGTAVALQLGHRISVDFDLFTPAPLSPDLLDKIERVFAGQAQEALVNNSTELTILVSGVKLTFLHYPFPVTSEFIKYEGLRLLGLSELAATKAYTIGRRGTFKDYVDLYCIIAGGVLLSDIISLAESKYGAAFNSRLFLEQIIYLEDITDTQITWLARPLTKDQIEQFFLNEIKKIPLA